MRHFAAILVPGGMSETKERAAAPGAILSPSVFVRICERAGAGRQLPSRCDYRRGICVSVLSWAMPGRGRNYRWTLPPTRRLCLPLNG